MTGSISLQLIKVVFITSVVGVCIAFVPVSASAAGDGPTQSPNTNTETVLPVMDDVGAVSPERTTGFWSGAWGAVTGYTDDLFNNRDSSPASDQNSYTSFPDVTAVVSQEEPIEPFHGEGAGDSDTFVPMQQTLTTSGASDGFDTNLISDPVVTDLPESDPATVVDTAPIVPVSPSTDEVIILTADDSSPVQTDGSSVVDNEVVDEEVGCVLIRVYDSSFSRCVGSDYTQAEAQLYCNGYAAQNPGVDFSCQLNVAGAAGPIAIAEYGDIPVMDTNDTSSVLDSYSSYTPVAPETGTLQIIFQGAIGEQDVSRSFSSLTWIEAFTLCGEYKQANSGIRQDCVWKGRVIDSNGVQGTPYPAQGIVDPDTGNVWSGTGESTVASTATDSSGSANTSITSTNTSGNTDSGSSGAGTSGTYSAWIINEGVTIISKSNVTQDFAKNHCQSNASAWQQQYKADYPGGAIKCIWQGEGASTWVDGVTIASDSGTTVRSTQIYPETTVDTSSSCVTGYSGPEQLDPNGPYNHLCGTGVMGQVRYWQRQSTRLLGDGTCSTRWLTVRAEYDCAGGWSSDNDGR